MRSDLQLWSFTALIFKKTLSWLDQVISHVRMIRVCDFDLACVNVILTDIERVNPKKGGERRVISLSLRVNQKTSRQWFNCEKHFRVMLN